MPHKSDNLKEKKQFWSKYFAQKLSVHRKRPWNRRTARTRRLEKNRLFWKRILAGASTGRTQQAHRENMTKGRN